MEFLFNFDRSQKFAKNSSFKCFNNQYHHSIEKVLLKAVELFYSVATQPFGTLYNSIKVEKIRSVPSYPRAECQATPIYGTLKISSNTQNNRTVGKYFQNYRHQIFFFLA